jgi:AbrB family looped-hinge helix DNA binding protein
MSSRGQVVIPKALREAAGIAEGDELEVAFDGQRLTLAAGQPLAEGHDLVRETQPGYGTAADDTTRAPEPALRPSKIWADRVRALAGIERLRPEYEGLSFDELWSEARRERKGGDTDG